jgi:hypothetical protein
MMKSTVGARLDICIAMGDFREDMAALRVAK